MPQPMDLPADPPRIDHGRPTPGPRHQAGPDAVPVPVPSPAPAPDLPQGPAVAVRLPDWDLLPPTEFLPRRHGRQG